MRQLLKITTTFALALVFTAGTAFGQILNQQGNNNTADGDGIQGAYLEQVQLGDRNVATVRTTSNNNQSNSYIQRQWNGNENVARVQQTNVAVQTVQKQKGTSNFAALLGNASSSWGNGTLNQVQKGNNNRAAISDGQHDNKAFDFDQKQVGNRNLSRVRNLSTAQGDVANMSTTQNGNRNTIRFDWGDYREGDLSALQRGNDNTLKSGFSHADQMLTSKQIGNNNFANVDMRPTAHTGQITQIGNNNTATVTR